MYVYVCGFGIGGKILDTRLTKTRRVVCEKSNQWCFLRTKRERERDYLVRITLVSYSQLIFMYNFG